MAVEATTKEDRGIQPVVSISELNTDALPINTVLKLSLELSQTTLHDIKVPVLAYRSANPGPTVGIVAAIHGNEINGIPVIQALFRDIQSGAKRIESGSLVGVLVLNVPGFLDSERGQDGQDLNRLMPGKESGTSTQQYAYRLFHNVIMKFDHLVDLHTASRGRKNSLYVRADMNQPTIGRMARAIQPQIIVHNSSPGGSVRGWAQAKGIHAVTIEIGDCSVFQPDMIEATRSGLDNLLSCIGVFSTEKCTHSLNLTYECERSYWLFSRQPGILRVFKSVGEKLERGSLVAEIEDIFGDVIEKIYAPNDVETVVVGLENNPVAKVGNRVIHLGVIGNNFATAPVDDGHL